MSEAQFRVSKERPEPPGWLKRDETMDAVYANSRYLPLGIFVFWYLGVLLCKQIGRLIWIAGWELKRRRRVRPAKALAAIAFRTTSPMRRPKDYWRRKLR